MLRASTYTFLGFQLNGLLDDGEAAGLSETCAHILNGSLFTWLEADYGDRLDLSLLRPGDRVAMNALFSDCVNVGGLRRRYIAERNGLSLLVAFCLEGAQMLSEPAPPPAGIDLSDLDAETLREMLRGHEAMVIGPGEVLIITVPAWWKPGECRELMDAVNAWCGPGIRAMVVPGKADLARVPADPFAG